MWNAWLNSLHTGAEWYSVPVAKRTAIQRTAARTKGVITPGNLASVVGFLLAVTGLLFLLQDNALAGIIGIALGRGCDLLDGFLARRTNTSSPFGEGLDAALDKVTVLLACVVFALTSIVPLAFLLFLFFEQSATAAATLLARRRGYNIHPIKRGKYATFLVWTAAIGFMAAYLFESSVAWPLLFTASAVIMAVASIMAALTLAEYLATIRTYAQSTALKSGRRQPLPRKGR